MRRCRACTNLVDGDATCVACGEPAPRAPKAGPATDRGSWAARRGPRGMELADAETVRMARTAGLLPASRRPRGITLVAMPTFMLGNGLVLAGVLGVLKVGAMAEALEPFPGLQASRTLMFTALLLFGLLVCGCGLGLLVGARWAWWTTLVFYVGLTLTGTVGVFSGALASGAAVVLGLVALVCLLTVRARMFVAVARVPARA